MKSAVVLFFLFPALTFGDVVLKFDSSYPKECREDILRFHKRITGILGNVTGLSPDAQFTLCYDPSSHRGFSGNYTKLVDPFLPTGTKDWYWWYIIEISHYYIPSVRWKDPGALFNRYKPYFNFAMAVREKEYISHAITEYVITRYLRDSDEFKNSIDLYENQRKAWLNPIRDAAIKGINPQTIYQIDENYNNFNAFACDVSGSMFFKLMELDEDFLKVFFRSLSEVELEDIEDLLRLVMDSFHPSTIDGVDKHKWLEDHPYFSKFHPEHLTRYSLDIITFSEEKPNTYPWHRITYINPSYFIVTGSSKRTYKGDGYTYTDPDREFFGGEVTYVIKNSHGSVVFQGTTKISENLWSNPVWLPSLQAGKYFIEVKFKTSDGVSLMDRVYFYVTDGKSLFDDENRFLVLENLAYQGYFFDVVSLLEQEGGFKILYLDVNRTASQTGGYVDDLDNIYIKGVLVDGEFFNVKMGYKNGALYFKGFF